MNTGTTPSNFPDTTSWDNFNARHNTTFSPRPASTHDRTTRDFPTRDGPQIPVAVCVFFGVFLFLVAVWFLMRCYMSFLIAKALQLELQKQEQEQQEQSDVVAIPAATYLSKS